MTGHGLARGAATAAAMFVLFGTAAAPWSNPFFTRMTPAGALEIALLLEYFEPVRPECLKAEAQTGRIPA